METPSLPRTWTTPVHYIVAAANIAVAITATVVLVGGWLMDITVLKQLRPSWPAMVPSTSICLLSLSAYMLAELQLSSSGRRSRDWFIAVPIAVALLALADLIVILTGVASGLDGYFFSTFQAFKLHSMSPATALHILGCSIALILAKLSLERFAIVILTITIFGVLQSLTVLLGYLLNFDILHISPLFSAKALHTSLSLFLLSISILLLYPSLGVAAVLAGRDRGSTAARPLLMTIVVVPVLMLIVLTFLGDGPNTRFVLSLSALFAIALQTAVALRNSVATTGAENALKVALVELGAVVQDRELLLAEVNHRSKNLLSVIQSVAAMSATEPESKTFAALLTDRLRGLATSQDLMIRNNWRYVALSELVASHLNFLGPSIVKRIDVGGPVVVLSTSAAQQIGQALQELATNALKYGALSTPEGSVQLNWRLVETGDNCEKTFQMEWLESGGPRLQSPVQKGYGLQVLEKITAYSMSGNVTLELDPEGLRWKLEAPQSEVLLTGNGDSEEQMTQPAERGAA